MRSPSARCAKLRRILVVELLKLQIERWKLLTKLARLFEKGLRDDCKELGRVGRAILIDEGFVVLFRFTNELVESRR